MRQNPRGIALLLLIAIIAGSAVLGGAGVAAYKDGKLAPPTEPQKEALTGIGAILAPLTGGASIPVSSALVGLWTALTGGTAAVAVAKSRKATKATQALWNAVPEDSAVGNDLPPEILSTLHGIDAKTDARIKRAS